MKKLLISLLAIFFFSFIALTGASAASPAGDVNGDGEVNIRDAATILSYLEGRSVVCRADAIDTNGDGKIDTADVEYLLKHLTDRDFGVKNLIISTDSLYLYITYSHKVVNSSA